MCWFFSFLKVGTSCEQILCRTRPLHSPSPLALLRHAGQILSVCVGEEHHVSWPCPVWKQEMPGVSMFRLHDGRVTTSQTGFGGLWHVFCFVWRFLLGFPVVSMCPLCSVSKCGAVGLNLCRLPAFLLCTLLRNAAKNIAHIYKGLRRDDEEHNIWSPVRKIQKGFDFFCLSLTYSPTCAAYFGWAFSVMLKFM